MNDTFDPLTKQRKYTPLLLDPNLKMFINYRPKFDQYFC